MKNVSIIIPCFNDGKYLPEAVASARAQTHSSVETIVVDDHSDDPRTLAVYEDLRGQGVTVICTPEGKKGPSAARNVGIAVASGEYILPLDADDVMASDYVSLAAAALDADPELGICYCKATYFGLKSGPWRLPPYSFDALLTGNMIFASAMFRKADWLRVGGYDEKLVTGLEDYALWLRIAALGRRVKQLDAELFKYRIKKDSRTAAMTQNDSETAALEAVYESCQDIFAAHAGVLVRQLHGLRQMQNQQACLFSWKAARHVFNLEWRLRQTIKKFLGRA